MDPKNPEELKRFATIMLTLAENGSAEISTQGIQIRFQALQAFTIAQVEDAAMRLLRTRRFSNMPTIAELVELIDGSPDDEAALEAAKVWQAVRMVGSYRSVVFDNATTMAVISYGFGGWVQMCSDMREDGRKWFERDFCRLFAAYRRTRTALTGHLVGLIEAQNESSGHQGFIPEPVLIGDESRAREILTTPAQPLIGNARRQLLTANIGNGGKDAS